MRFLRVLIGAILLIVLIVFAVANKAPVAVSLYPTPFLLDLPLYLLVFAVFFAGLLVGVLLGRFDAWMAARRKARQKAQAEATASAAHPAAGVPARSQPLSDLPPSPPVV